MGFADWHQRYLQQSKWTKAIRRHLFNKKKFSAEDWILEVGSGTGAILGQVAEELPCQVAGIDINVNSLAFSHGVNRGFNLAQADAHRLPFRDNTFSITYCHYLLMWVEDSLLTLIEMQRVTQPGGFVIALAESDYSSRIDFPAPLDRLGEIQSQALQAQGADIEMGRKLGQLFHQAGLSEIEVGILGTHWQSETEWDMDKTEVATLWSDLHGILSEDEITHYLNIDRKAREDSERVLFVPTFYAKGTVI